MCHDGAKHAAAQLASPTNAIVGQVGKWHITDLGRIKLYGPFLPALPTLRSGRPCDPPLRAHSSIAARTGPRGTAWGR